MQPQKLSLRVEPAVAALPLRLQAEVSTMLNIDANRIKHIAIRRRSIDARQRRVMVNLEVEVWIDVVPEPQELAVEGKSYPDVSKAERQAIVVGAGPAGLFAALELIEKGIRPIVLERGKDVESRAADMAQIARSGHVDPDSNYCFGEGGAGAYSDGKLYTRSHKRGPVEKVLSTFVRHGAQAEIMVDAHPHIGTDKLPQVIRAIRQTIVGAGGEVHFGAKVTSLLMENGKVEGVKTAGGAEYHGPVILATGHSARDVYRYLQSANITLEAKGIAVGVRLEHPQELIDRLQYHSPKGRGSYLPAAEYSMLTRVDDRAVYSFCMCPGGVIIPAATEDGQCVVNGMSPAARSGRWANSGMVVEVLPDDIPGEDPLRIMRFQEGIERTLYNAQYIGKREEERNEGGATQAAPAQRMTDFVEGKPSATLPESSFAPGIYPARMDKLLPPQVAHRLQEGFREFDKKQRGFLAPEAVVIGAETRTSSPVRIPRDPVSMQHTGMKGLYPCGEGAGYAGGIVSAALDGIKAATALAGNLEQ